MFKRFASLILSLLILVTFSGCWDMAELNERVFILGIGIDSSAADGEYDFTFQTARFSDNSSYTDIKITSDSLGRAVRELEKSCGNISFEHLSLVLLGKDVAKSDFYNIMDYLYREGTVRRQSQLAISETTAGKLIGKNVGSNGLCVHAAGILENTDSSRGQSATMTLSRLFVSQSVNEGCYIPILSATDASGVSSGDASGVVSVSGAYCYSSEGFTGTMSTYETELTRLFSDRQSSGIVESVDIDGRVIRYKIEKSLCKKSSKIISDKPIFKIEIELDCSLIENPESSGTSENLIEKSLNEKLSALIQRCISELGASPLGLDRTARQSHHLWFSENNTRFFDIFRESEISINIDCNIKRGGSIK